MKKFLLTCVFLFSISAESAEVIGFRGKNEAFDQQAFYEYARQQGLKPVELSASQVAQALKHIQQSQGSYQLYGFSLGAQAVRQVLAHQHRNGLKMPQAVVTIGAYKTVDVDFAKYGVPFVNYFDDSGLGNKSPGIFLRIPHLQMQQKVNEIHQQSISR